jgi:hypothetical protein
MNVGLRILMHMLWSMEAFRPFLLRFQTGSPRVDQVAITGEPGFSFLALLQMTISSKFYIHPFLVDLRYSFVVILSKFSGDWLFLVVFFIGLFISVCIILVLFHKIKMGSIHLFLVKFWMFDLSPNRRVI